MDHETAIRIQAAERYVLEEFPPEERAEFEEHYFECPECADEVRSASIFAANAKVVLREERAADLARLERGGGRPAWRGWWVLAASAALNLALLAGFGLERFGPHASQATLEPQLYSTMAVTAASRGSQPTAALAAGSQFFGVHFDVMPGQQFQSFEYQIVDAQGAVRETKSVPAPGGAGSDMYLSVPVVSLEAGQYTLVLRGRHSGSATEIGRRTFSIPR